MLLPATGLHVQLSKNLTTWCQCIVRLIFKDEDQTLPFHASTPTAVAARTAKALDKRMVLEEWKP